MKFVQRGAPKVRRIAALATAAAITTVLAACGADAADDDEELTTVTFAMDYYPGPAHNALAWAIQEGLFEERGIEVELLPFTDSPPDSLIASGTADLGINWGATYAISNFIQEMPVTAIFALYQHYPAELGVLNDSGIERPADLAGLRLGTFGDPFDPAVTNTMIANDGGTEDIAPVTVGTSIYQALSSRQIDGFLIYASDQFEFEKATGSTIRTFRPTEYGAPDSYGNMVLANNDFLAEQSEIARAFMEVFTEAYQRSLTDTDIMNDALEVQFEGAIDRELVDYVTAIQAEYLFVDADGRVGVNDLDRWQETVDFMREVGLLVDGQGDPFTGELDLSQFVTNEYLPES